MEYLISTARDGSSGLSKEQLLAIEKYIEQERDLTRDYTDLELAVMGARAIIALESGALSVKDWEPIQVQLAREWLFDSDDEKLVKEYDEVFNR